MLFQLGLGLVVASIADPEIKPHDEAATSQQPLAPPSDSADVHGLETFAALKLARLKLVETCKFPFQLRTRPCHNPDGSLSYNFCDR
jgi:hypothetical protein